MRISAYNMSRFCFFGFLGMRIVKKIIRGGEEFEKKEFHNREVSLNILVLFTSARSKKIEKVAN